jgi:rRNA-processing protein FCF1
VSKAVKCIDRLEVDLGKVEFVVLDVVIRELERLAGSSSVKRSKAAALALDMIRSQVFKVRVINIHTRRSVDSMIVDYASANGCYVATLDSKLMKELRAKGIGVVTLRDDLVTIVH